METTRCRVWLVGGADVAGHAAGTLTIGRRNVLAARSVLWQNGIMVHGEDVGGASPRTVTIAVASHSCRGYNQVGAAWCYPQE